MTIATACTLHDDDHTYAWSSRAAKVEARSGERLALSSHRKIRDKAIRLKNAGVEVRGRNVK